MDDKSKKRGWAYLFYICAILFIILLIGLFVKKNSWFLTFFWAGLVGGIGAISLVKVSEYAEKEEKAHVNDNQISEKKVVPSKNDSVDSFYDDDDFYSDSVYVDIDDLGLPDYPEYYIVYIDSNGEPSMRNIVLKGLTIKKERVYLNAFCKLRNDNRMFLTDRIQKLKYKDQVIHDPTGYFYSLFTHSDFYVVSEFRKQKEDALKLFTVLGKADGRMVKAESDIIVDYIKKYLPQVSEATIEKIVKDIPVVSIAEFNTIIKKLKKEPADNAEILEYYKKLYELKKKPDPLEKGIFEKVTTSLGA